MVAVGQRVECQAVKLFLNRGLIISRIGGVVANERLVHIAAGSGIFRDFSGVAGLVVDGLRDGVEGGRRSIASVFPVDHDEVLIGEPLGMGRTVPHITEFDTDAFPSNHLQRLLPVSEYDVDAQLAHMGFVIRQILDLAQQIERLVQRGLVLERRQRRCGGGLSGIKTVEGCLVRQHNLAWKYLTGLYWRMHR